MRGSYWIRVGPKFKDCCHLQGQRGVQDQREEAHKAREGEAAGLQPQGKDCQQPGDTREKQRDSFQEPSEGGWLCHHLKSLSALASKKET